MKLHILKEELKQLKIEIRTLKSKRKTSDCGYVSGLDHERYIARHKHLAYCLMRGRTYEQIEEKCYINPNVNEIKRQLERFVDLLEHPEIRAELRKIEKIILKKSNEADERREAEEEKARIAWEVRKAAQEAKTRPAKNVKRVKRENQQDLFSKNFKDILA